MQPRQGDGGVEARISTARASAPARSAPGAARPSRSGDRSQRSALTIPAGRVTDHRINLTLYSSIADGGRRPRRDHRRARADAGALLANRRTMTVRLRPSRARRSPARRHFDRPTRPPVDLRARAAPPAARPCGGRHPWQPLKETGARGDAGAGRGGGLTRDPAHCGDRLRGGIAALHYQTMAGSAAAPPASGSSGSWGPTIWAIPPWRAGGNRQSPQCGRRPAGSTLRRSPARRGALALRRPEALRRASPGCRRPLPVPARAALRSVRDALRRVAAAPDASSEKSILTAHLPYGRTRITRPG